MKVAIYCRLSEEDRNKQLQTDDSESIQNQKTMLRQYSEAHGWEIFDIYSDGHVIIGISRKNLIKSRVFGTCPFSFFVKGWHNSLKVKILHWKGCDIIK